MLWPWWGRYWAITLQKILNWPNIGKLYIVKKWLGFSIFGAEQSENFAEYCWGKSYWLGMGYTVLSYSPTISFAPEKSCQLSPFSQFLLAPNSSSGQFQAYMPVQAKCCHASMRSCAVRVIWIQELFDSIIIAFWRGFHWLEASFNCYWDRASAAIAAAWLLFARTLELWWLCIHSMACEVC